jgi:uncharacterized protein YggE
MKTTTIRILTCLVLVPAAATGASSALGAASPRTVTVQGQGVVTSVPTRAEFTFGVTANGSTATAALTANARAMTKLLGVLKSEGIAAVDLQTAAVSLSPNRNPSGSRILNYTASNSVTALIRAIAKAGPVIDAAVRGGATDVEGPTLSVADSQRLTRAALQAGIADARSHATAIAAAAHLRLGPVVSVSEQGAATPLPFSAADSAKAAATPVAPGTIQTEVDLVVVFALR